MAEVSRLLQAVEVVDDIRVYGVNQERVRSYGPLTGVYIKGSDHPGFWV